MSYRTIIVLLSECNLGKKPLKENLKKIFQISKKKNN